MIGRTEFQNVSGTRCPTDFVEVPSILMEQFLVSPHSLAVLARHHVTDAPLQLEQLRPHLGTASQFPATETHDELMLASLDQALHRVEFNDTLIDSGRIMQEHHRKKSLLRAPLDIDWQARIAHLATYPASYYAYPLDRSLARAIWDDHFKSNPLDEQAGRRIKFDLLASGGATSSLDLLTQVAANHVSSSSRSALRDILQASLVTQES